LLNEKPEKYTKRFFWVSHTHLIFDGALVVEEGGDGDGHAFRGYIDDVSIHNRVLAASEILAIFNMQE